MSNKNKQPKQQSTSINEDSNDKSQLVDIVELSSIAQNKDKIRILELEEKSLALSKSIDLLLEQLQLKEEEISYLKNIVASNNYSENNMNEVVKIEITDEELIADVQLRKLRDNAKIRELTLDEIKKFDLLVKNKRLAQGNATVIEGNKITDKMDKSQLLKLATSKVKG